MRPRQVRLLPLLIFIFILILLVSPAGAAAGAAHLRQPQVAPESPLEPKPQALVGDGQHTWLRSRRHSPHFPLCSFCCNCCRNRGCGFCCRT